MKMTDHHIATLVWIIVVIAAGSLSGLSGLPAWLPLVLFGLVLAATVNLLHTRYVLFNAGEVFSRRVREVLGQELLAINDRMHECERKVDDVKEAQITIAGQFRGATNRHP